ncbi:hypothetical protein [Enterococcus nangangensis]|uniref:hypothetical protein n=1 Tax=Enterococcus nangangensis TaxID=2559926 RepID=UPI0010F5F1BE|nr:hypothetical protein [Enterococcus nangangensis]
MKPNLNFYLQKINTFVQTTEELGEGMNPFYEKVRQAIDDGRTENLTADELTEVHEKFVQGVEAYRQLQEMLTGLRAPAKVMGIHKRLEKTFAKYVAACQKMTTAVENQVDADSFDASEKEQDEATDEITFCIQRLTQLLR